MWNPFGSLAKSGRGLWNSIRDPLLGTRPPPVNPDDPRYQLQHGQQMGDYATGLLGRGTQAPQVGRTAIDQGPQNQFRGGELALMQQLQGVASGQQQGAGEMAVRRQVAQALAAQQAQQRMARGGNAAIAARAGARAAGDLGVNAAGMSAQSALSDQAQARGALGQLLGQGRSADIGLASTQAGLDQQRVLANQQAGLQQQGLNNQMDLGLLSQLLGMDQATLEAQLGLTGLQQQYGGTKGYLGDLLSAGGQMGAAYAMKSDRRAKRNISDGSGAMREFLDGLKPVTWDYKDPKDGKGRHGGVIAQDVERSRLGREIVSDTPDGKVLDARKVLHVLLGAAAHLNDRVGRLENGR